MSVNKKIMEGFTMRILPEETGAVVIDMQEKLMMAMNETKACEEKAAMLLKGLRCCRFRR